MMTGQPYLMRVIGFRFRAPRRAFGYGCRRVVDAVGPNVTRFQPGDECSAPVTVRLPSTQLPDKTCSRSSRQSLSFEQAAAVPTSAFTALQALRAGRIQPRQKVLIVGASGGVGLFAVQIAKSSGAEVTGVCSTSKVDMVRSIGADHVIDYTRGDFTRSGPRYDLILDMGGNRSLSQLRRALVPRGTLVLVGGEGGDRWIGIGRSLQALVMSPFVSHSLRWRRSRAADLQV